jgi:hypothetical protein
VLDEFAHPLKGEQDKSHRHYRLDRIDRRLPVADIGVLPDLPGIGDVFDAVLDQNEIDGEKHQKVQEGIENGPNPLGIEVVDNVDPYVHLMTKGIGTPEHEKGRILHPCQLIGPLGGGLEEVPHKDIVDCPTDKRDYKPTGNSSGPFTQELDHLNKAS